MVMRTDFILALLSADAFALSADAFVTVSTDSVSGITSALIAGAQVDLCLRFHAFAHSYEMKKGGFEHAQNAHIQIPMHAQSVIREFALH